MTKRETIVLILSVICLGLILLFPSFFARVNEMMSLIFFVLPLGIILVTDPQRRKTRG